MGAYVVMPLGGISKGLEAAPSPEDTQIARQNCRLQVWHFDKGIPIHYPTSTIVNVA